MKLHSVRVTKYRSIEDSGEVLIEPSVTALVGQNESGKTAFLEAVRLLNPVGGAVLDAVTDYPREQLGAYRRRHHQQPDVMVSGVFRLMPPELEEIEAVFGEGVILDPFVRVMRNYKGELQVQLSLNEKKAVAHVLSLQGSLPDILRERLLRVTSFRELKLAVTPFVSRHKEASILESVAENLLETPLESRIWEDYLAPVLPRFVSFSDDDVMPSLIPLGDLVRASQHERGGKATVLALLELAAVDPQDLYPGEQRYEELRASLESAALGITEELRRSWKHNPELEVSMEIIPEGVHEGALSRSGPLLSIRVGDKKTGLSLPLHERSHGFAWYMSFLVRLAQLSVKKAPIVLLLDEPGLLLHASVKKDFFDFVQKRMTPHHQVLFSTHSPFLLNAAKLHEIRGVVYSRDQGSKITSSLDELDEASLLPIQGALASLLAEKMLPRRASLCVHDLADYFMLSAMDFELKRRGYPGLSSEIQIVPLGGAAQLMPWLIFSQGNDSQAVWLQSGLDREGLPWSLPREYSQMGLKLLNLEDWTGLPHASLEDLFDSGFWFSILSGSYGLQPPLLPEDKPQGMGMIAFAKSVLKQEGRPWDRTLVAQVLARNTGHIRSKDSLAHFQGLFDKAEALLL